LLNSEALENALHRQGLSNQDKALLCLALEPVAPRPLGDIRQIGVAAGWAVAKTANLSAYLGRAKGLAIAVEGSWKLTQEGKRHVAMLASIPGAQGPTPLTQSLRALLTEIKSDNTRAFVEEAIRAAENGLWRSAVVLSWVGAVAVLYDHVIDKRLVDFNTETIRRNPKWKAAVTNDDLSRMEEFEFLQVLAALTPSVIGKNVKQELEGCLKLRNGCGHPNSLRIADARVAAHIESLMLNVFEKF
jgi:hypothetical protein